MGTCSSHAKVCLINEYDGPVLPCLCPCTNTYEAYVLEFYRLKVMADKGNGEARFFMARCYEYGVLIDGKAVVPKDDKASDAYYNAALESDDETWSDEAYHYLVRRDIKRDQQKLRVLPVIKINTAAQLTELKHPEIAGVMKRD